MNKERETRKRARNAAPCAFLDLDTTHPFITRQDAKIARGEI